VLALVAALQVIVSQITTLERQIADGLDAHPDGAIFPQLLPQPRLGRLRRHAAGRDRR
jgi:hypothetical protein